MKTLSSAAPWALANAIPEDGKQISAAGKVNCMRRSSIPAAR